MPRIFKNFLGFLRIIFLNRFNFCYSFISKYKFHDFFNKVKRRKNYLIFIQPSMLLVRPPLNKTVTIIIIDVVVKISCLASVDVFRIAFIKNRYSYWIIQNIYFNKISISRLPRQKAIAPLKPENTSIVCIFNVIFRFSVLVKLIISDKG